MSDVMTGLAFGGMQAGVNNMFAQHNAEVSFRRQKQLMQMQNQMNLSNAKSMPGIQVEGLRMAGFNPAMLNGAGTQAAPTVSQGNADMPQTIPFNASDALAMSQIDNVNANTEKVKEEERGIKQKNDIVDTANNAAVQGYLAQWNREQEDLEKAREGMDPDSEQYNKLTARIKELEKMKGEVTDPGFAGALGIVEGTKAAGDNAMHNLRILGEYLKGAMSNAVAQKQLNNGTVDALASMPKLAKEKLAEDIEHVRQSIEVLKSQKDLNEEQVNKLKAEIQSIGDAVLRANLNDPNMIKSRYGVDSKEWKNWTDTQWRNAAFDVGKGIVQGAALGGGLGMVNKILGPKNSFGKSSDYDWNGSGFEDGNVAPKNYHWSPANDHGIGDKPEGVSQFDWNQMQKRAENAGKKRR